MNSIEVLKNYFGFDSFRSGQSDIVDSILSGRDTLGVMPTGAGKSVCYQVPALMMRGITLVISPLISLMQDQVTTLTQSGIRAAYINSSLTQEQLYTVLRNARSGMYKLIYIAPERLDSEAFMSFARETEISMITVDEAHCISQWGQDFRPSYLNIPKFAHDLPNRPIMTAFTATATEYVRKNIIELLELHDPFALVTGFDRQNLYFEVKTPSDKFAELVRLIKKYSDEDRSGIIYCSTRKNVEGVYEKLKAQEYSVSRYHAGLSEQERRENQEDFIFDRIKIMVATNAFGMGIDKSNVSFVIHYNMPKDVESYYQEAGRAGRDGSPSDCILLYSGQDVITGKFLINKSFEDSELDADTAERIKNRDLKRLSIMANYSMGSTCLRRYILRYFGEKSPEECGNCSVCCSDLEMCDITVEAQKIMSCIVRAGQRFGLKMIMDILRGRKTERITERELDKLSTYGIMSGESEERIKHIAAKLESMGYIAKTDDEYGILKITPAANAVLLGKIKIEARIPKTVERERKEKVVIGYQYDPELMETLRRIRAEIASAQGVPAYVVFTDASLRDMCVKLPCSDDDFLSVSGVGRAKLERYGDRFIEAISEYAKRTAPQKTTVISGSSNRLRNAEDIRRGFSELMAHAAEMTVSEEDVTITALTDSIVAASGVNIVKSALRKAIADWLIECGLLVSLKDSDGHEYKNVTEKSAEAGIYSEWVSAQQMRRSYIRVKYTPAAQRMVIDSLDKIERHMLGSTD